jgi:hypothetical protein
MDRTGALAERFATSRSVTIEFTFDTSETYNLEIRRLGEKAGQRGTVELMDMKSIPSPRVPRKRELPGRVVGEASSDGATICVTLVEGESRFSVDDKRTLLVSPRTPYNRIMLPRMALATTVRRERETVLERSLRATLDSEIGCYYRAPVETLQSEDTVVIETVTPPQLARHDGYETAFLDMSPVRLTVDSAT